MIWKQEFKKLIRHPMLWCLLVVFLMFNGFLLWVNIGEMVPELQMAHEEVLSSGIDEGYYQECLSRYDALDMVEVKELKQELFQYYPTGSYKEFIDTRYENLNERVAEIVASGEDEGLVYPGEIYRLHKKLYVNILRWVFLEMGLLVVFAVLFLMDYERMQKTTALVYASHIGRNIQWTKWCVGILTGTTLGCVLVGVTLAVWFWLIPYEGFWNVSMSAAIMTETRGIFFYPFITFFKMNIVQYLIATLLVGILLVVILGLIAGSVQLILHNSYLSFVSIALLLLGALYISGYSTQTWLDVAMSWNPAALWYTMGNYFMEGAFAMNFKEAELINLAVQFCCCGILGKVAYQKFLKTDD